MPIQNGDIQFVKTQVMDDVPEGGGGPTGTVVVSGISNEIFPDISEADRAIGNVRMRKLVLGVRTDDTSSFLGSNMVIAEPPNDDNVAMTAFSTGEMFDRRIDAVARLEAYLNIGPTYAAFLYGNHIAGQNTLLIYQKTDVLPPIGATLVLTKREGYEDEAREYVRITEAASELRNFEDSSGAFSRYIVTLKLQNFLSQDFGGFDMQRFDFTQEQVALKTKISDTVVADAARYYGVVVLDDSAAIGDFTIKAATIFSQLVPSAQIETPIADARTNQLGNAVVSAGGTISQNIFGVFSPTQNLFIGGGIAPNTLSLAAVGITLTDTGGRLFNGSVQVGTVDYENGVLSLTTDVFGSGGNNFVIVYSPAAAPAAVNQAQGFEITAENRASSYVRTIEPPPVPGTLAVSYMAGGRWYVLREDGSGAIRGSSTAFGAGTLNPTSGTMAVTLGALPDVGSSLIMVWVQPDAARDAEALTLDNDGKFYWPFNSSGAVSLDPGAKAIQPGELEITWIDPDLGAKTAVDNGSGLITGDATGTVNYAKGTLRLSPNALPPPGTTINVAIASVSKTTAVVTIASQIGNLGATNITPGSVSLTLATDVQWGYLEPANALHDHGNFLVVDDGAGNLNLLMGDVAIHAGTINYSAGTFVMLSNVVFPTGVMLDRLAFDNVLLATQGETIISLSQA